GRDRWRCHRHPENGYGRPCVPAANSRAWTLPMPARPARIHALPPHHRARPAWPAPQWYLRGSWPSGQHMLTWPRRYAPDLPNPACDRYTTVGRSTTDYWYSNTAPARMG